jgi:hypothetical protein
VPRTKRLLREQQSSFDEKFRRALLYVAIWEKTIIPILLTIAAGAFFSDAKRPILLYATLLFVAVLSCVVTLYGYNGLNLLKRLEKQRPFKETK